MVPNQPIPKKVNVHLSYNGIQDDGKYLRRLFQYNILDLHPNDPVWESKLQTCPEPINVGFIMYSPPTFQIIDLVNNVLEVIK